MKYILMATIFLLSSVSYAKSDPCKNSKGKEIPCKGAKTHTHGAGAQHTHGAKAQKTSKKASSSTEKKHGEEKDTWEAQEGKMSFWSNSVPLSNLFALIADFARVKLEIDPAIKKSVSVRYEKKTHWKQMAKEIADKHHLKITITDKLIKVNVLNKD